MKEVTIAPVFVKGLMEGCINKGFDASEILQAQGISTNILNNPKFRVSALSFSELNRSITQLLGDEALGLLSKPIPMGFLDLSTRACSSCETIKDSLNMWRDVHNMFDNGLTVHTNFTDDGGYLAFKVTKNDSIKSNYIIESLLLSVHRIHCWLAKEYLPIEHVDLAYPEPEFSEEYRFVFYDAPVRFNQKKNAIHFSRQVLKSGCYRDKNDLKVMREKNYISLLTQPKKIKSTYVRIRVWMENLFREGHNNPQLIEAAEHINLSEQTLRRYLNKEGYTFQQLKDDTRRDMAIHFIDRRELSVEEIGFQLGFSEASTFIRAFKKWTGLTPLAYRKLT